MKIVRTCKNCGKEFEIYPSQAKLGEGVYCSNVCKFVLLRVLRLGVTLSSEQIEKARQTRIKNYEKVACLMKYRNEWGELIQCRNKRKRNRKSCGEHSKKVFQRYYKSNYYPHIYLDILA